MIFSNFLQRCFRHLKNCFFPNSRRSCRMSYIFCIPPAPQDQTVPGLCFEPPSFYNILEDERALQEEDLERHPVLQLRVILRNFAPKIWRRVLIPKETTFFNLHVYLKFVMGWSSFEYSDHQFETKSGKLIADDVLDASINYPCWDILITDGVPLSRFLRQREDSVVYLYHSEDSWECDVIVEAILDQDSERLYPRCIGGRGNAPPEGCGGVEGYKYLLEVRANPNHIDYDQLITDWLDMEYPNFDTNRFNARVTNREWESSTLSMNPPDPPILRIEQVQYRTRRVG